MFSHIGTGIGAGLLYLPISVGGGGIWSLLVLSLLCGPIVLLTHRSLTRFCLSSSQPGRDITQIVHEHFGDKAGYGLMLVCFMSMFPVLLLYTVGITNVSVSFWINQLGFEEPSRSLVVFVLVTGMIAMFCGTEQRLLRLTSVLVFPLALILIGVAVYLIPQWKMDFLQQSIGWRQSLETIFLALPAIVFSFYHAPVCSSFARSYQKEINNIHLCIRKTDKVHFRSSTALLFITLFFVFSCIMAMTPEQLLQAREANLPTLSVLANQPGNLFFSTLAPVIAFVAILTSFFGFFLGTVEVMNGLIARQVKQFRPGVVFSVDRGHKISLIILAVACWIAGIGNWSVLAIMEVIVSPMMAILLFFLPIAAICRIPELKQYKSLFADLFIIVMGTLVMTGFLITQFL